MKILIATGGSGGHVFPALCVAQELKKNNHQIIFAGTSGAITKKIEENGFDLAVLSSKGVSFASVNSFFVSIFYMMKAMVQSFSLLKDLKPDVVVGFGGYGAFPVLLVSSLLRYPTLIHEQNVVPGRANRILSKVVRKIAISFEKSRKYFPLSKTALTGCPCRSEKKQLTKEELLKKFNLQNNRFTILVLGGSQGSHRINQEFLKVAPLLKKDLEFQVIHLTGGQDCDDLKKKYDDIDIPVSLFSFLDEIEEAYRITDLVVSRAGAVTIFEIALFGLQAILIPYPFAKGHQRENAKILCDTNVAKMIEEKDLSTEKLKGEILNMALDKIPKDKIVQQTRNFFFPDAAVRLTNEITLLRK